MSGSFHTLAHLKMRHRFLLRDKIPIFLGVLLCSLAYCAFCFLITARFGQFFLFVSKITEKLLARFFYETLKKNGEARAKGKKKKSKSRGAYTNYFHFH